MHVLPSLLLWLGAYLVGALPFGYLVARLRGVDIFQHGSGNIGATNAGRVLGRPYGILVFALDFLKGALPVVVALSLDDTEMCGWLEVGAGLAAFLGHLFPIYLRFRGGKGVATGAGVVAVLLPGPAFVGLVVWIVVAAASRYVSLASLAAAGALCLARLVQTWPPDVTEPRIAFGLLAAVLVVVRHRANIGRLLTGQESQLRENRFMRSFGKTLHVLAVGLWFGSAVFFTFVVALSLFDTFEKAAQSEPRPVWLPQPPLYAKSDDWITGPREQGSRAAGVGVGPLFASYFLLQGACGLVALVTALPWTRQDQVQRWRTYLLSAALILVLVGWPLEHYLSALRVPRNDATDAYLQAAPAQADALRVEMQAARAEFRRWHLYSVMLNLATIVLVMIVMGMAAQLPSSEPPLAG